MVGLILAIVIAIAGVHFLASELERVSHSRANADPDHPSRSLELGIVGRVIGSIVPVAILLLLFYVLSVSVAAGIVALVLELAMGVAFVYLRKKGFHTLISWLLITVANSICCSRYASATKPAPIYIVWLIVTIVIVIVMTIINLAMRDDEGADEESEDDDSKDSESDEGTEDREEEDSDKNGGEISTGMKVLVYVVSGILVVVVGFAAYAIASTVF